ncbi:MAG: tetratricopeptide repeat protein [Bacteroidota bacterium]
MKSKDLHRQFERYLLGQMTAQEAQAFEDSMDREEDIRQQFEEYKILAQGAALRGRELMKERLKKIEANIQNEKKTQQALWNWPLGTVATTAIALVLTVIVLALIYLSRSPADTPEVLFADAYDAYEWTAGTRDTSQTKQVPWRQLYQAKRYGDVLPLLEQHLQEGNNSSRLQLLLGICKLETNDPEGAREAFQLILQKNDPRFSDHAKWYTGLSFLKQGNASAAKTFFQQLADDPTADHRQQAADIIQKLQ